MPAAHLTQDAADGDPVLMAYFPALQALHAAMAPPSTSLYRPAGQRSHAVPALFDALPTAQLKQELDTGQKSELAASPFADANVAPDEY